MSHTTWMSNYWQGAAKAKTAEIDKSSGVAMVSPSAAPFVLSIAPVAGTPGKTETAFVVTVAPNPATNATAAAEAAPMSETVAVASELSK
jgi:hypothetical protein